jgi:hypothetical protein
MDLARESFSAWLKLNIMIFPLDFSESVSEENMGVVINTIFLAHSCPKLHEGQGIELGYHIQWV